jgi:hypothetical protein
MRRRRSRCRAGSDAKRVASGTERPAGEPAWEKEDRLDDPAGVGTRDPDAAPEILGGA